MPDNESGAGATADADGDGNAAVAHNLGKRVQLKWTCWMANKVEQTVAGCIRYFCTV
jgi:hypothetical protein